MKKKGWPKVWIFLLSIVGIACHQNTLPRERLIQYKLEIQQVDWDDSGVKISLANPVASPLRIWILSDKNDSLAQQFNPLQLAPLQDTTFHLNWVRDDLQIESFLGDPARTVQVPPLGWPFNPHQKVRVLQGSRTNFTHQGSYAQFALDFDLKTGDTILAAHPGVVVGVVEGYSRGGNHAQWRDYANYLTLYDPTSGVFTQYAHLHFQGALVSLGDSVTQGQPIGLSGSTGHSTEPHLHFVCLVPDNARQGLKSVPFTWITGENSLSLKAGQMISSQTK